MIGKSHYPTVEEPSALFLECKSCGQTYHRVLRGRISGKAEMIFEGVVKCTKCGLIHRVVVRETKPTAIPIIVSRNEHSERKTIDMKPEEVVQVGDRLFVEGKRVEITSIESSGKRIRKSKAGEIEALWAKSMEKTRIRFSVNKGNRTTSEEMLAAPDEEFFIGDIVEVGKDRVVIHRIKIREGIVREGSAKAEDIVRIYGKVVRETLA